jgi:PAS domain S-box-containing protein
LKLRANVDAHVRGRFSVIWLKGVFELTAGKSKGRRMTLLSEPSVQTGLLAHAVDSAPAALFVVHESGRIVGANQYACAMLGYDREELLDLSVDDLAASPDLEPLLREGEAGVASLLHSDGTTVAVSCQARPAGTDGLRLLAWVAQPLRGLSREAPEHAAARRTSRPRASGGLTPRELEILELMAEGFENAQISHQLFISRETVKSHVRRLLQKLRARSRTHAVALAFRRGLID